MRRISANYIFPVSELPLKNGIVEINDEGEILNLIDTKGNLEESRNLEFYNGVIVPGFINTHCHLELSDLKEKTPRHMGLPGFLKNVVAYKKSKRGPETYKAIERYDGIMKRKGIVAVGDISNYNYTIKAKKQSTIYYHTFIEAIGIGENTTEIFEYNKKLFAEFTENGLSASITPHAPYSVSENLFNLIKLFANEYKSILSIHNQETASENQMFYDKTGDLVETLIGLGIDFSKWESTGKGSLESVSKSLPKDNNIIFVHNTYSSKEDIKRAVDFFSNAFWCLCPLSNIYIENKLPGIGIFTQLHDSVTIGTDSLASNHTLSILDEMKAIIRNCDTISFDQILQWGTLNGARALKIENTFGSIEMGKTPGLNLITNFDFNKMQITDKSDVNVLF